MMRSHIPLHHWTKYAISVLAQMLLVAAGASVAAGDGRQASAFKWRTASPESQGMDRAKLAAMKDSLAEHHTKAFLVIRNDRNRLGMVSKGVRAGQAALYGLDGQGDRGRSIAGGGYERWPYCIG